MKILVTGGAGFIGSHLVDRLVRDGYRVRVVDNLSSGRLENIKHHLDAGNVEIIVGDLKDPQVALEAVEGVDVVFHFAANPEVRVSTTNPEIHFNENIVATFNLLEAMRMKGVKELVFASSSSVYGEPEEIPVDENAPIRPVSVYGASKAACEALIHAYTKLYGVKAVVLRYANIVGPRLRHGVVWDFINKLLKNPTELEILGDGKQVRSYIYVDDAVEATITAWRRTETSYEAYNIASEDWITVDEVTDEVIKAMGLSNVKKIYKPVLHGVGWPGDVKRIALKIGKIKRLGFKPAMNSREAVRTTVRMLLEEIKEKDNNEV
ncbi:MAG: NAD-dependent epimerase/dehydratase family protein [Desulfurococcaceae archaeon]|nr:NAD-dependent epimerase/dehydratase family protein [Desulfurococcaceae archaeon]